MSEQSERATSQQIEKPETYRMKFADELVQSVRFGEKTLTIRLADEWQFLYDNDRINFLTEDEERFAEGVVKRARTETVSTAHKIADVHSGYPSPGLLSDFVETLQGYYPYEDITKDTKVRLIHFEVTDSE